MPGDLFAAAADDHLIDVGLHHYFAVAVARRNRVIVGPIAYQRQRRHPRRALVTSVVPNSRQRQKRLAVALETLADRSIFVSPQSSFAMLSTLCFQMLVESFPAWKARNRHHKVAPRIAHQPFHLAFVVALARPPKTHSSPLREANGPRPPTSSKKSSAAEPPSISYDPLDALH